jgi:prepilin-type N-terminal cleavage/methylation domain-containing protein
MIYDMLQKSSPVQSSPVLRYKGFTLSELLVTLGILGLVATYTIPKVLTAQADKANITILKETWSSLASVVYEGTITGEMSAQGVTPYLMKRLNAVKQCPNGVFADGCMTQAMKDHYDIYNSGCCGGSFYGYPGVILSNGVMIWWVDKCCSGIGGDVSHKFLFDIDANAASPPNEFPKDLISGYANYGSAMIEDYWGTQTIQPGQIRSGAPDWDNYIFEK